GRVSRERPAGGGDVPPRRGSRFAARLGTLDRPSGSHHRHRPLRGLRTRRDRFQGVRLYRRARCRSGARTRGSNARKRVSMSATATWPIFQSKLVRREEVAERTIAFHFEKPSGWTFKAGQFIDMTILAPPQTDAEGN